LQRAIDAGIGSDIEHAAGAFGVILELLGGEMVGARGLTVFWPHDRSDQPVLGRM
jgi:hypothetical protein